MGFDAKHLADELHRLLLGVGDLDEFLNDVSRLAAALVGTDGSCGITLIREGFPATVASSDDRAVRLDEVQYGLDDGPCLHAARTSEIVLIEDLALDDRWTKWRLHALENGVRSSLSTPLALDSSIAVGALNMYAATANVYGAEEQRLAQRFAGGASRAIDLAARISDQTRLVEQLRAAVISRSTIDKAIGIIMAQNRCSAEDAFAILRRASQNSNVKLSAVAAAVNASVSGGS